MRKALVMALTATAASIVQVLGQEKRHPISRSALLEAPGEPPI